MTDSFIINVEDTIFRKTNLYTKKIKHSIIKTIPIDTSYLGYGLGYVGISLIIDDSLNYYFIQNLKKKTNFNIKKFCVSKYDKTFSKKWSLISSGNIKYSNHINATIIDTMIYVELETETLSSSYSYTDIACINNLTGKITRGIRADSFNLGNDNKTYQNKTGLYRMSYPPGSITRFNKLFQPIKTMGINWSDYFDLALDLGFGRRNFSYNYIISDYSNPSKDNSFSIMDSSMNAIYILKHPLLRDDHFCKFKINIDRSIDILAHDSKVDSPYGIRHIHIKNDWKTIEKNTFYILPHTLKNHRYNDNYSGGYSDIGHSGGFFNDSTFIKFEFVPTFPVYSSSTLDTIENLYIHKLDFSLFPYSQEVCGETFSVDTVPLYPAATPPYIPIAMTSDTFSIDYSFGPWRDTTEIPYHYNDPGTLSARFTLSQDTFCGTKISLISDTTLRLGESRWHLNYIDAGVSETLLVKDTLHYSFKHSGRMIITHTHALRGCVDTAHDTVFYSIPIARSFAKDSLFCAPYKTLLSAYSLNYSSYLWSTGSASASITVSDTGLYWVQKVSACGIYRDTIHIAYPFPKKTQVIFPQDSIKVCAINFPYSLTSGLTCPTCTYSWNIGLLTPSINISNFKLYKLSISDGCHVYTDSVTIYATQVSPAPITPDSVTLCASIYTIYRPILLHLEEKIGAFWVAKDSIILSKNEKKYFRWIDSCGSITYDSIFDYQKSSFMPLAPLKSYLLCDINPISIVNPQPSVRMEEKVGSNYIPQNPIFLKLGVNFIRRTDPCGNSVLDTFTTYSTRQAKNILKEDTLTYCAQVFPLYLHASKGYQNYIWNTGSTLDSISITNGGMYSLTVSDTCYIYIDSTYIRELPREPLISLLNDSVHFCLKDYRDTVFAPSGYNWYIWEGVRSPLNYYRVDTHYKFISLQIPRICDTLRDTSRILWTDIPIELPQYEVDTSYCDSLIGKVKITLLNASKYLNYSWYLSENTPQLFTNIYTKTYFIAQNQCQDIKIELPLYYCAEPPLGIPSAFSPNGDQINDLWSLNGKTTNIIVHHLAVFSRWGEKVYESAQSNFSWNGTYKGELVPSDVFTYILDYEILPQHIRKVFKGTVTLVR